MLGVHGLTAPCAPVPAELPLSVQPTRGTGAWLCAPALKDMICGVKQAQVLAGSEP